MDKKEKIQELIKKIDKLPEHFYVAVKVAKMLDGFNMDLDISELTNVISLDQSLTTLLLKLCNSAHYGFTRKIVSIKDAVAKLGFKTVKSLVFVAVSQGILNQEVSGYSLAKGELWKNSISCAVYSRHIAKTVNYKDPEVAFTAGLLRDIGKLTMHEYVGVNYDAITKLARNDGISFIAAEELVLGFNHSQIGAEMAIQWNFPPLLVDVIKYHHSPHEAVKNGSSDVDIVSIIHLADSLTMMLGVGMGIDGMMYNLELASLDRLGIPTQAESIELFMADAVELNGEIESLMGIVNGK
jgi:putative nucleotidyltransferase with HDIG domain